MSFPCSSEVSQPSIEASSSPWPRSKPSSRSCNRPLLNCITSVAQASAEKRALSRPYSSIARESASRSSVRHSVVDSVQPLAHLGPVPGERFELRPDLRVAGRQVLLDEADRGAPLLGEGPVGLVHRPLAIEDPAREPLQGLQQQLVDRAEVVVDEAVVLPGLLRQPPGRDPPGALPDQKPLGGIEEGLDIGLPDRAVAVRGLDICDCELLSHTPKSSI